MIAKVMRGQDTLGLLRYLYGPGRANEHTDPHLVAAWRALGVPDPGRDPDADLSVLARRLDRFVRPEVRRHVWHCAVRVAPTDRPLTDTEWDHVARKIAAAGGVAPLGDDRGCRWVALRHDGAESHHIHLLATLARQDDTNPDIHNDALRLRDACRALEDALGLRPTSASNNTSAPSPTRGETEKAHRQGLDRPSRAVLERLARRAAVASRTEQEFLDAVRSTGALVRLRETGQGGPAAGYALALPGDTAPDGGPVWFSGTALAPDLSLPRVRDRFAGAPAAPAPLPAAGPWGQAATAVGELSEHWDGAGQGVRAAGAAALGDVLTAAAVAAPSHVRQVLQGADRDWSHAGRPPVGTARAAVAVRMREAARALSAAAPKGQAPVGELAVRQALQALAGAAEQVTAWYRSCSWEPQERSARLAAEALRAAVGGDGAQPTLNFTM
ncbi:relaxase/mobilization nuclease domain-containing protein [Nocardiopsis sp. NPDC050513]|uniref:relaxase/mobilization nuclease domain-containing protein n=1 Tax=Nocardiopsis sp. NPDC050513 TaxID=3364338 RepID=UPI0037A06E46